MELTPSDIMKIVKTAMLFMQRQGEHSLPNRISKIDDICQGLFVVGK